MAGREEMVHEMTCYYSCSALAGLKSILLLPAALSDLASIHNYICCQVDVSGLGVAFVETEGARVFGSGTRRRLCL